MKGVLNSMVDELIRERGVSIDTVINFQVVRSYQETAIFYTLNVV